MNLINGKEYKHSQYFNDISDAEIFIKENNIEDYAFTTPIYLESGIELNWNSFVKIEPVEGYNCIRCMNEDVLHITIPNKSNNCSQGLFLCRKCCKSLIKELDNFITEEEFKDFIDRKNKEILEEEFKNAGND